MASELGFGRQCGVLRRRYARLRRSDFFALIVTTSGLALSGVLLMLPWAPDRVSAIGSALLTGAVLAGVFAGAESSLDRRRAAREEVAALRLRLSLSSTLEGIDMPGVSLRDAYLVGKNLSGANLTGADLSGARLRGADLTKARLDRANLDGCDLTGANLDGALLPDSSLVGAILNRASLVDADLTDANFIGAVCDNADFTRATLRRAYMSGANFRDATLVGASLRSARAHADFTGADLTGADLTSTRFHGATLSGCRFDAVVASRPPDWPDGFGHPTVLQVAEQP